MEPLGDAGAVARCVGAVRRTRTFSSNLYAAPDQLECWSANGGMRALVAEGATLVLRADRDFHRLFHVAESQAALGLALDALPADGTYVADLIGQDAALDELCATYAASGFAPRGRLVRMVRVQTPGEPGEGGGVVATPEDAPKVAALLDRLLDRFVEQVPDLAELEREARAERLLLVRRGEAVAGMLMYEIRGRTALLRFWHVDADARGRGIGRTLMTAFLARCAQARRLLLWVIGDNDRSISIYRHYGFAPDGLTDRIMIRHKEQQP